MLWNRSWPAVSQKSARGAQLCLPVGLGARSTLSAAAQGLWGQRAELETTQRHPRAAPVRAVRGVRVPVRAGRRETGTRIGSPAREEGDAGPAEVKTRPTSRCRDCRWWLSGQAGRTLARGCRDPTEGGSPSWRTTLTSRLSFLSMRQAGNRALRLPGTARASWPPPPTPACSPLPRASPLPEGRGRWTLCCLPTRTVLPSTVAVCLYRVRAYVDNCCGWLCSG